MNVHFYQDSAASYAVIDKKTQFDDGDVQILSIQLVHCSLSQMGFGIRRLMLIPLINAHHHT